MIHAMISRREVLYSCIDTTARWSFAFHLQRRNIIRQKEAVTRLAGRIV